MRRSLVILLSGFVLLLGANLIGAQPMAIAERIRQATVYLMQVQLEGDLPVITCTGSGTLVDRSGLILTNAHFARPNAVCPGDTLFVAFTVNSDQAPVPRFRAGIAQLDEGLDLALLRIDRQLDGRLLEPGSLSLPFVEPGDSTALTLDDTLTVAGFPDVGDDPVTLRQGTIVGFTQEPGDRDPFWIHLHGDFPGTLTGGGAYNLSGQLVGIPTTVPRLPGGTGSACTSLQDSNRDGLLNREDRCLPRGDAINILRPVEHALPLLRAASLGLDVSLPVAADAAPGPEREPRLKRMFFASAVNEAGMPNTVVSRLPAGSNGLYLFFDYENLSTESLAELRVTRDGILEPGFSLAPARWRGKRSGMWHIGSNVQPWPNGVYDFTMYIDGRAAGSARLVIGGGADPAPVFSDLVFGIVDRRGTPLGNGFVLPSGNIANARFIYRNMPAGLVWTAVWYFNGFEVARTQDPWSEQDGESGAKTIQIEEPGGLPPGNWRVELYIEGKLAATSDFIIAGARQGILPQIFSNSRFTTGGAGPGNGLSGTSQGSVAGVETLTARFDWQQIAPGTPWQLRLLVDDEPFFDRQLLWSAPSAGQDFVIQTGSAGPIPDGTWEMQLLINNVLLDSAEVQVGIGRLFVDRLASAEGLRLRGRVVDSQSGDGLEGIQLILLTEDYSIADFEWREEQIFATARSDRNGDFEVQRLLQRNTPYSILVQAEGWLPLAADSYRFGDEAPDPIELFIPLTRDR